MSKTNTMSQIEDIIKQAQRAAVSDERFKLYTAIKDLEDKGLPGREIIGQIKALLLGKKPGEVLDGTI
jgi:hypothetical protein